MALIDAILRVNLINLFLGLVGGFLLLVWLRHRIADLKIKNAGGVRAPILASNPFSAARWYYNVGRNQFQNRLPAWLAEQLDNLPGDRKQHFAEFSVTGKKRALLTRDPQQIKTILTTKFSSFGHGPQWHSLWRPFLGDGIFATDGQQWHDSRSMVRPMFVKDRFRNLAIFDRCTEKLVSKLPPSGVTVNVKDLFYRWTLDTITEFLLGENVNSLDNPNHEIANAIEKAQQVQMLIFVLNPIAPLIPKAEYHKAIRIMEEFIEPLIARAVALPQTELEDLSKSDQDFTFLHSIAQFTKNPKEIRDQIMSVLLAGRDTTAATMSWAIYELCNAPQAWARLRSQVLHVLGPHGRPSYETLKDLTFLRHILDETLRLHPAVPMNMRQAMETTTVPGAPGEADITLLKGDTVTILTLAMHEREDLYPPTSPTFAHPSVFSPERWEHWTPKPWTYTPFHGGPRICVGQNVALTEMAYCLTRLAQKYDKVEYRGDWHAQKLRADIIGTPALDVDVAFYEKA